MMDTQTHEQHLANAVRRAARRFATGVTIVAVWEGQRIHALTANSFVTLSLQPALIGIAVRSDGRMRHLAERVGCFGVSVLNELQSEYASHYANRHRGGETLHLALSRADTAPPVPIVPGCVAFFACQLREIVSVGDHDLLVGAVLTCDVLNLECAPLIFLDGKYQDSRAGVV
jgi:flavin reductase (DIM6/NTAB) family NADH-FMN oxidoreductase RutF